MKEKTKNFLKPVDSLCSLVFVIFLTLRACDVVLWPWWIVCMPLFVAFGISIILIFIVLIALAIVIAKNDKKED